MSVALEGWAPRYYEWSVEDLTRQLADLREALKSAWEQFQRATSLEERDRLSRQMRDLKRQITAVASALSRKDYMRYPRVPPPEYGLIMKVTPEQGARTEAQTRTPELLERFRKMREELREREPEVEVPPKVVAPPRPKAEAKPSALPLLALLALTWLTK